MNSDPDSILEGIVGDLFYFVHYLWKNPIVSRGDTFASHDFFVLRHEFLNAFTPLREKNNKIGLYETNAISYGDLSHDTGPFFS